MKIPEDLVYTKTHEWLRLNGRVATVGLTHFMGDMLGDITYVDVAPVRTQIRQGSIVGVVEAVKAVTDIFSPISGEITEINPILAEWPSRISLSPYEEGWLFRASIAARPTGLLAPADYDILLTSSKDAKHP